LDNPAAWLYTVARNKVVKAATEAARRGELAHVLSDDETGTASWTSMTLRATAEDTFLARQVVDAIADLPDRQRTVTYLRHVQGWTAREVADLLDCAPGTIWAHTNHGVTAVRTMRLCCDARVRLRPLRLVVLLLLGLAVAPLAGTAFAVAVVIVLGRLWPNFDSGVVAVVLACFVTQIMIIWTWHRHRDGC